MKDQYLLRDGRYGTLCDQIRMGEVTFDNLHGKQDSRKKLAKDPIFARIMIDTIAGSSHKYFDSVSESDGLKFEMMMRICADIIKENPDMVQNITPLLHKIKNIPPKSEQHARGLIILAETFTDIVQQESGGMGMVSLVRKNAAKNTVSIMENLSLVEDIPGPESAFIKLANKAQEPGSGFTTEEKEAMDKAYLNFRKNNPWYDYDYLDHSPHKDDKTYMDNYIVRKKEQIRQRLQNRDNQISGVVSADRIAEAQINGTKYEQQTTSEKDGKRVQCKRSFTAMPRINGHKYEKIKPKDDKFKESGDKPEGPADNKLKERILNKMIENKLKKR